MKDVVLKINQFSQGYNRVNEVVHDISLEVCEGEIFAFIGHNGAGKSTTIKSIVGILPIEKGEISIMGKSVADHRRECQKLCAYIPDNPDLYSYMTGIEYIRFMADIYRVSEASQNKIIEEMAKDFEMTAYLGNLISTYSHGMRQKIALMGAFVHQPKLLVLDEPFVGLDPKAIAVLKKYMRELCENQGAVFFSTHVLDVAERLCHKVAMLDHGQIVLQGNMEDVIADQTLEAVFLKNMKEESNA